MESKVALELMAHVSGAVNAKDAYLRLLTTCREAARADAAAILRARPQQAAVEIVVTDGRPVKKEYLFSNFVNNPAIAGKQVVHDEGLFLFDGAACAANLDVAGGAIVHLEWGAREAMALETLKVLQEALAYAAPLVEHFKRLDSRISIAPAHVDVRVEDIDHELDTPYLNEVLRRVYLMASARAPLAGGAFFLRAPGGLEAAPGGLFGEGWNLPAAVLQGGLGAGVVALLDEGHPRELDRRDTPGELSALRGALAVPILAKSEPLALALFRSSGDRFTPKQTRDVLELMDAAALSIVKAFLAESTRDTVPVMLVGVARETLQLAETYGDAAAPVLIRGETGTGKESIARFIHRIGKRRGGPFVAFSGAELVETLAESQLFGHVKGAFTGATADAAGIFAQASGGTLFLDEIHLLNPPLQAKMLRAIETGEIRPVGSSGPARRVDVRVVAATNRDLDRLVEEGKFLHDLLMRLNVLELELPPLRQNKRSLTRIAQALLTDACARNGKSVEGFTPRARQALLAFDFPGNIRELKNIVEKAVVTSRGREIDVDALPKKLLDSKIAEAAEVDFSYEYDAWRSDSERQYLVRLLQKVKGNVSEGARLSGIHRTHLHAMLKRHGLESERFKP